MNHYREMIEYYGADILGSDLFLAAGRQQHHFLSTVGDHSLHALICCLAIASLLEFFHIYVNRKALVQGCLCHDLGILGRYEGRFSSGHDCCYSHPVYSLECARELIPDLDDTTADVILHHMWPLSDGVPNTRECRILTVGDKLCIFEDETQGILRRLRSR